MYEAHRLGAPFDELRFTWSDRGLRHDMGPEGGVKKPPTVLQLSFALVVYR